jgi:hypothetical protein
MAARTIACNGHIGMESSRFPGGGFVTCRAIFRGRQVCRRLARGG